MKQCCHNFTSTFIIFIIILSFNVYACLLPSFPTNINSLTYFQQNYFRQVNIVFRVRHYINTVLLLLLLPEWLYTNAGTRDGPLSVCLSQVGVLSKWLNESYCFLHGRFLRPILHSVRKFRYLQKYGYFPLELCSKLLTKKNFVTAYRSSKRVTNWARERWTFKVW